MILSCALLAASMAAAMAMLLQRQQTMLEPVPPPPAEHSSTSPLVESKSSDTTTELRLERAHGIVVASVAPGPNMVRVVDEFGRPVAGATVRCSADARFVGVHTHASFDVEEAMAEQPARFTNANGLCTLAITAPRVFVYARFDDCYGHMPIEWHDSFAERDLMIRKDCNVRALVVSESNGEPCAFVPIKLSYPWEDDQSDFSRYEGIVGRCDAAGDFVLWHAQCLAFWRPEQAELTLQAVVAGAETQAVRVLLNDLKQEPIRLLCPPFGSIQLRYAAEVQQPSSPLPRTNLYSKQEGGVGSLLEMLWHREGTALLHPVALDQDWQVGAANYQPVSGRGPRQQDERLVFELLPQWGNFVRFRVLLPDGEIYRDGKLAVRGQFDRQGLMVQTDASGFVYVPVGADSRYSEWANDELRLGANVVLPGWTSEQQWREGGDLRLLPQALLASGRILDAASREPIAASWRAIRADTDVRSDGVCEADGSFAIWGMPVPSIQLTCTAPAYAHQQLEVSAGEQDQVVLLRREQQLVVTVHCDPNIDVELLRLEMRSAASPTSGSRSNASSYRARAGWRREVLQFPVVEAGEEADWVLAVLPEYGSQLSPLCVVPKQDCTVVRGGFVVELDLRGALAMAGLHLRAVDQPTSAQVYVRQPQTRQLWQAGERTTDHRLVMTPDSRVEAIAVGEATGCVRVQLQGNDQTIAMPLPTQVHVTLRGRPDAVPADRLRVQLVRLMRQEPMLDELAEGGHEWLRAVVSAPPTTVAELAAFDGESDGEPAFVSSLSDPPRRYAIVRRGTYALLPVLLVGDEALPLANSTETFLVAELGARIDIVLNVDSADVLARLQSTSVTGR